MTTPFVCCFEAYHRTQCIIRTVNAVAKGKGLDIIVDANSVYSGGDKLLNGGEDITDAILKRLNPAKTAAKDAGAKYLKN